ncbi:hypothetical protein [Photobacterium ganghwense]|uniref:hypothetical protein n=1 Tax=Photobacterium ganghwense TaxID=320778 RepID=UPI001A8FA455|nr:hypothetical protein [Photobacterium ganghwense]QSV17507.1 hypothetical protein FH974_25720 [Photobacterium ganghwense]
MVTQSNFKLLRFFNSAYCLQMNQQFNERGTLTIGLELAPMVDGKTDFSNKMSFQCKPEELAEITRVLVKQTQSIDFRYHGTKKNKSLRVANADNGGIGFAISLGKQNYRYLTVPEFQRVEVVDIFVSTLAIKLGQSIGDTILLVKSY